MTKNYHSLSPWLQLLRLPNLFTVLGDPLAGTCIASLALKDTASSWSICGAMLCSLLLYAFGLIQNDLCDLQEDARLRPERPLPQRRISVPSAIAASSLCLVAALLLALILAPHTLLLVLGLAALVCAYNMVLKRYARRGAIVMGLCRSSSMLLGASVIGFSPALLLPACAECAYIAIVTEIADGENRRQHIGIRACFPGWIAFACWLCCAPFIAEPAALPCSFLIMLLLLAILHFSCRKVKGNAVSPAETKKYVGRMITALILWQSAWIVLAAGKYTLSALMLAALCLIAAKLLAIKYAQS